MATGLDTDEGQRSAIEERLRRRSSEFGAQAGSQLGDRHRRVIVVLLDLGDHRRTAGTCSSSASSTALNNGFIYAAMALVLVLIYKATGVVNFAQGEMAMFGTFIAYVLIADQGLPVWLGDRRWRWSLVGARRRRHRAGASSARSTRATTSPSPS